MISRTEVHKSNEMKDVVPLQSSSSLRGKPNEETKAITNTNMMSSVSEKETISRNEASNYDYLGISTLLLVIASNRPEYLQKTLHFALQYHPKIAIPIVVSQDGNHPRVNEVVDDAILEFKKSSAISFDHIQFESHAEYENGYFRLADHFKFALSNAFSGRFGNIQRVIILEEDLQISPDFFEFFAATAPILDEDKSLLTVSAWNDNGFYSQVKDETFVYRSDFFPGLGWMMTKRLWEELSPKWPAAYWDDWLREPKQRQGRQILRPEVCRTLHFGVHGVSNAQYSDYLKNIRLNDKLVPFTSMNLSYLQANNWDSFYLSSVRAAPLLRLDEANKKVQNLSSLNDVELKHGIRLRYSSLDENSRLPDSFASLAKWSGAMNNVKAMVPRTAYKGIVSIYKNGVKIHLVPSDFS